MFRIVSAALLSWFILLAPALAVDYTGNSGGNPPANSTGTTDVIQYSCIGY